MNWISEKQWLPVKHSPELVLTMRSFTGEVLQPTQEILRNICAYWCQSRLMGVGGFAAARPSILGKESGGALAWNRGHLPFKPHHITYIVWHCMNNSWFETTVNKLFKTMKQTNKQLFYVTVEMLFIYQFCEKNRQQICYNHTITV